jgi:hypothetical protein
MNAHTLPERSQVMSDDRFRMRDHPALPPQPITLHWA